MSVEILVSELFEGGLELEVLLLVLVVRLLRGVVDAEDVHRFVFAHLLIAAGVAAVLGADGPVGDGLALAAGHFTLALAFVLRKFDVGRVA